MRSVEREVWVGYGGWKGTGGEGLQPSNTSEAWWESESYMDSVLGASVEGEE